MTLSATQEAFQDFTLRRSRGILFVLSGPSGVGKDTILDEYQRRPEVPDRCVTATTRPPRREEIDGIHYHFLSADRFAEMRKEEGFLESAVVHQHSYGTPRAWVEERLAGGRDVILRVDVQGGRSIRDLGIDAVTIFILPPTSQELERRLRARGTDSEQQIQVRLSDARGELEERRYFQYWVVNHAVDQAVETLAAIVTAERARALRWTRG